MHLRLIFLCLCLCFPATAGSQDQFTDAQKLEKTLEALRKMNRDYEALQAQFRIDPLAKAAIDAYNESWVEYFSHQQALRNHALSALRWQLITAYCLTVLVLGVVGLGIYLSIIEVRAALKKPSEVEKDVLARDTQSTLQERIELTLSVQKLQVTSAVTGVVILVLSLAFLYLFVKEVFEIDPQDFSAQSVPEPLPEEDQSGEAASGETAAQ